MPKLKYKAEGREELSMALSGVDSFDLIFPEEDETNAYVREWLQKGREEGIYELWDTRCLNILDQPVKDETTEQAEERRALKKSLYETWIDFSRIKNISKKDDNFTLHALTEKAWEKAMKSVDSLDEVCERLESFNLKNKYALMGTPEMRGIYGMIRSMKKAKTQVDEAAYQEEMEHLEEDHNNLLRREEKIQEQIVSLCDEGVRDEVNTGDEGMFGTISHLNEQIKRMDTIIRSEKNLQEQEAKAPDPEKEKEKAYAQRGVLSQNVVVAQVKERTHQEKAARDYEKNRTQLLEDLGKAYEEELKKAPKEETEKFRNSLAFGDLLEDAFENVLEDGTYGEDFFNQAKSALKKYHEAHNMPYSEASYRDFKEDDMLAKLQEASEKDDEEYVRLIEGNPALKQADKILRAKYAIEDMALPDEQLLKDNQESLVPAAEKFLKDSLSDIEEGKKLHEKTVASEKELSEYLKKTHPKLDQDVEFAKLRGFAKNQGLRIAEKSAVLLEQKYQDAVKEAAKPSKEFLASKQKLKESRDQVIQAAEMQKDNLKKHKAKAEVLLEKKKKLAETNRTLMNDITKYQEECRSRLGAVANTDPNPRQVRVQKELQSLYSRIDRQKEDGHNDTPEFTDMKTALSAAVSDFSQKNLENLQIKAAEYLKKKQGIFHIDSHTMRSYRLNLAQDLIQSASQGLESIQKSSAAIQREKKIREGAEAVLDVRKELSDKIDKYKRSAKKPVFSDSEEGAVIKKNDKVYNTIKDHEKKLQTESDAIIKGKKPAEKQNIKNVKNEVKKSEISPKQMSL